MSLSSYILIWVAFLAGVLKSGFGIGAGVFLTPILALVTDPKEAVVMVAGMMLLTDVTAIYQYWRQWNGRDILSLAPPCLLGVAAGVFLLNWFTPDMAKRAIGVIGLVYVAIEILRVGLRLRASAQNRIQSLSIGLIAGVASALSNSGGVFLSAYMAGRLSKEYFVGTIVMIFFCLSITKVVMFTGLGLFHQRLWITVLSLLPLMFVGGLVGRWINRHIRDDQFKRWIFLLIIGACVKLVFF